MWTSGGIATAFIPHETVELVATKGADVLGGFRVHFGEVTFALHCHDAGVACRAPADHDFPVRRRILPVEAIQLLERNKAIDLKLVVQFSSPSEVSTSRAARRRRVTFQAEPLSS